MLNRQKGEQIYHDTSDSLNKDGETQKEYTKGYVDIESKASNASETKDKSHFWIPHTIRGSFVGLTKNGARDKKAFKADEICVYDRQGNVYYCSSHVLCNCPQLCLVPTKVRLGHLISSACLQRGGWAVGLAKRGTTRLDNG